MIKVSNEQIESGPSAEFWKAWFGSAGSMICHSLELPIIATLKIAALSLCLSFLSVVG